jgi:hypothetical protein
LKHGSSSGGLQRNFLKKTKYGDKARLDGIVAQKVVHIGYTVDLHSNFCAQLDHQVMLEGPKVISIEGFVGYRVIVGLFDVPNIVDFVA